MSQPPIQPHHLKSSSETPMAVWRLRIYRIIFESDTKIGQQFDRWLIALILLSVAVVIADSVEFINLQMGKYFTVLEWLFTIVFTLEYIARLVCVRHPLRYALSFFGIVDLFLTL